MVRIAGKAAAAWRTGCNARRAAWRTVGRFFPSFYRRSRAAELPRAGSEGRGGVPRADRCSPGPFYVFALAWRPLGKPAVSVVVRLEGERSLVWERSASSLARCLFSLSLARAAARAVFFARARHGAAIITDDDASFTRRRRETRRDPLRRRGTRTLRPAAHTANALGETARPSLSAPHRLSASARAVA